MEDGTCTKAAGVCTLVVMPKPADRGRAAQTARMSAANALPAWTGETATPGVIPKRKEITG